MLVLPIPISISILKVSFPFPHTNYINLVLFWLISCSVVHMSTSSKLLQNIGMTCYSHKISFFQFDIFFANNRERDNCIWSDGNCSRSSWDKDNTSRWHRSSQPLTNYLSNSRMEYNTSQHDSLGCIQHSIYRLILKPVKVTVKVEGERGVGGEV